MKIKNKLFDGYLVICEKYQSKNYLHYNRWAAENCEGRIASDNFGNDRLFVFSIEEEAMAFKLTWL